MTARKDHLDALAVSLLLACCLFWGFQQVLVKATIPELPPIFQAALRFAGATVLLWLWCWWRRIPLFGRDGSLFTGILDTERAVSASTEMAATVSEVAHTASDLAKVAESLAAQVARYKI